MSKNSDTTAMHQFFDRVMAPKSVQVGTDVWQDDLEPRPILDQLDRIADSLERIAEALEYKD